MAQNNYTKLDEADKEYWESRDKYALLKENESVYGGQEYSIFLRVNGQLMMSLMDDYKYSQLLCQKMLLEGIAVFDNISDLQKWAKS